MARGGVPAPAPHLTLLAVVIAAAAARVAGAGSVCDTANCGKGNCTVPPLPPTLLPYECDCDPGWSRTFKLIPISPCTVPNCSFNSACFNLSLGPPPGGIPITDICVAVDCGPGGACKKGGDGVFSYTCECQPGFANMLNSTAMPCIGGNCRFGDDCAKLGLTNPGGPSPAPAPVETDLQN